MLFSLLFLKRNGLTSTIFIAPCNRIAPQPTWATPCEQSSKDLQPDKSANHQRGKEAFQLLLTEALPSLPRSYAYEQSPFLQHRAVLKGQRLPLPMLSEGEHVMMIASGQYGLQAHYSWFRALSACECPGSSLVDGRFACGHGRWRDCHLRFGDSR